MMCTPFDKLVSVSNIHGQPSYTLYTILMANITDQSVLQIFCSQGPLWVKCLSLKRGIIQSNIDIISRKVNQVIYTCNETVCLIS